jgi:hypothetical protein
VFFEDSMHFHLAVTYTQTYPWSDQNRTTWDVCCCPICVLMKYGYVHPFDDFDEVFISSFFSGWMIKIQNAGSFSPSPRTHATSISRFRVAPFWEVIIPYFSFVDCVYFLGCQVLVVQFLDEDNTLIQVLLVELLCWYLVTLSSNVSIAFKETLHPWITNIFSCLYFDKIEGLLDNNLEILTL